MYIVDREYCILVNRDNHLANDYVPRDLMYVKVNCDVCDEKKFLRRRAANALEKMFLDGAAMGYVLAAVSGFRSYERQRQIYQESVDNRGEEYTARYIAKPGESEHQTGLAMDVSIQALKYDLVEAFADTPEGMWLSGNAYRYGFILRYMKGRSAITGYAFEPWHIRYVGHRAAAEITLKNITLEQFVDSKTCVSQSWR